MSVSDALQLAIGAGLLIKLNYVSCNLLKIRQKNNRLSLDELAIIFNQQLSLRKSGSPRESSVGTSSLYCYYNKAIKDKPVLLNKSEVPAQQLAKAADNLIITLIALVVNPLKNQTSALKL